MVGRFTVEMLGGFRAVRPDGMDADSWVRPSAKRMLCLLLLTPERRLSRQQAAELLFPALTSPRAANAVAKSASWCRGALGLPSGGGLVAVTGQLCWEAPVDTDVDAALGLVRDGTSVTQLVLRGGLNAELLRSIADDTRELLPEWDDAWLNAFRDELSHARGTAAESLASLLENRTPADRDESVLRWRSLVAADPLDESRQTGLLRALLAVGRFDEARAAYTAYRQVLWRELHGEPGAELEAVWRQGTAQPVSRRVEESAAGAAPISHREGQRAAHKTDRQQEHRESLPGREALLDELESALRGAEARHGGCAVVVGEAGIGKSAVLTIAANRFRARGWRVLTSQGRRTAATYSTIERLLRELSEGTAHERLMLSLLANGPSWTVPETRPETSERALHLRVADALEAASAVPTLLVIDDLHDADGATVRLLRSLFARPRDRSWSLLVAARPQHRVTWSVPVTTLSPLQDSVIEALIRRRCPGSPAADVRRAVDRAGGNPLFAREIANLLASGQERTLLPPSALQLFRHRLRSLPRQHRVLIPLIVLAGPDANIALVTRAIDRLRLDQRASPTGETLQSLLDSGLVAERDGLLTPSHPLVGEGGARPPRALGACCLARPARPARGGRGR